MKYEFIVDEKVTGWRRNYVTIEADSKEEALEKCIDFDQVSITSSEFLIETEIPQYLDGIPTHYTEIYDVDPYNTLLYTDGNSR